MQLRTEDDCWFETECKIAQTRVWLPVSEIATVESE